MALSDKIQVTELEFEEILEAPVKSHFDYKSDIQSKIYKKYISPTNPVVKMVKKMINK